MMGTVKKKVYTCDIKECKIFVAVEEQPLDGALGYYYPSPENWIDGMVTICPKHAKELFDD